MNYLLKSKPKKDFQWKIFLIVLVFGGLSFFYFLFPNFTVNFFSRISRPIWVIRNSLTVPFIKIKDYFLFKDSLIEENLSLKEEIFQLKLKTVDYEILKNEFDNLKNELGRGEVKNRIISKVLSRPPFTPYDTLVIDSGSENGIVLGDKVYISNNIIIGFIKNITPKTSFVELFSNSNVKQEAILSRTGNSFILEGLGGGNLSLEVPKDMDVIWGDTFTYPDFSFSIIGSVYYIDSDSQSSFKKIFIRVPENIFSNKYVFIEEK